MVNFPQSLPLPIVPRSFTLSTCLACGGTDLCDPVLVTVIMSSQKPLASPFAYALFFLLILLRRKINLGREIGSDANRD